MKPIIMIRTKKNEKTTYSALVRGTRNKMSVLNSIKTILSKKNPFQKLKGNL